MAEFREVGGTPHKEFPRAPFGLHHGLFFICLFTAKKIINMACSTTSYASTKETTNYARLCRLLVDVGSQALRNKFDSIHPPAGLHGVLLQSLLYIQYCRHLERREFSIPLNGPSCTPLHLHPYLQKILMSHC